MTMDMSMGLSINKAMTTGTGPGMRTRMAMPTA
jgi:hypothetical protein